MTSSTSSMTIISDTAFEMERTFNAPPDLVFRAYTDPEAIPLWWGPRSHTTEVIEMDVRVGGIWRFVQKDADGNQYPFHGEYLEVEPIERLVNTFIFDPFPDSVMTDAATFTGVEEGTRVTVRSSASDPETVKAMLDSGMEQGAIETWDRLAEYLDTQIA